MQKLHIILAFFIISNIYQIKSEEKNNSIISFKFKTFYPITNNSLFNSSSFTTNDFVDSIHHSKIYLEVGVGDENNYNANTNQSINIIVDLKEIIFSTTNLYFEKYTSENNYLLCHYNTSKSSTFSQSEGFFPIYGIKTESSYAKESFKVYTDISLSKYKIQTLNFVNTINHNITNICGYIGLGYTHLESHYYNFISQLHSNFGLPGYSFIFNYTNEFSDEGIFIFGNMPHNYLPRKFKEQNLIPIYSKNKKEPLITSYELVIERERFKIDSADHLFTLFLNPDVEGFEFPENTFMDLDDIFFSNFYGKKICHKEVYDRIYRVIYCDGEFGEKEIKAFPNITFFLDNSTNFSVSFYGKDLFYFRNDKYFFRIIENVLGDNLVLGRIFLKKYLTVFNQDNMQVYFYNNKNSNENNNNDNSNNNVNNHSNKTIIIIIIASVICALIFFPLGIYFGKKLFKKRNKKAYELNDGYDYSTAPENNGNDLNIN